MKFISTFVFTLGISIPKTRFQKLFIVLWTVSIFWLQRVSISVSMSKQKKGSPDKLHGHGNSPEELSKNFLLE